MSMPKRLLRRAVSVIAVPLAATAVLCAAAYAATPAEAQKARHEHYEQLGESFKAVRDQSNASSPDWAALQKAVEAVQHATVNQQQWFPKGSGPEAGKTRALADIWTKTAEFDAAAKLFEEKVVPLVAAAKAKDVNAVKAAFREVGGSCKNCHDKFRGPE
jgi:cytochrome c556